MRRAAFLILALLAFAACGEPQPLGSEQLADFTEAPGERLGGLETPAPDETPAPLGVGAKPTPPPTPPPTPTPPPRFFDIALTADSPFYSWRSSGSEQFKPGNAMIVAAGVTIRVTNQDTTAGRSGRSFTDEAGTFDSGILAPGQTWSRTFEVPAQYTIVDKGLTFARASLEVAAT